MTAPRRRLLDCVERWPECSTFGYDPRCCRFPKSCSASAYLDGTDESLLETEKNAGMESAPTDTDWLKVEPINAGWVRRRQPDDHRCEPPLRKVFFPAPGEAGKQGIGHSDHLPDGAKGDLWRCGCGRLWEIGLRLDGGNIGPKGTAWRRASAWSRLTWWLP